MKVSFGRKIPIVTCNIKDTKNNRFVPAICYELDCKDKSDFEEVERADGSWWFKNIITHNMRKMYFQIKHGKEYLHSKFFILQNSNNDILGICETTTKTDGINIEFLERKPYSEYKYVGQSLISVIGKNALDLKIPKLFIYNPTDVAIPFYTEKCGFIEGKYRHLEINKNGILNLIQDIEEKTGTKF